MRPRDASPEAWRVWLDLVRKMPPGERLARALELSETARLASEAGLRQQYPQASVREIFLRLAQRSLGGDLFARVYGNEWSAYESAEPSPARSH